MTSSVTIVGAGLAGAEAALQLAGRGVPVRLVEMKPGRHTEAQVSDHYAELVCSNSFRSNALDSAVGVIKEEMRRIGGRLIRFADTHRVPAGGALAVDRARFSRAVTDALRGEPEIEIIHRDVRNVPEEGDVVIATGPLTTPELAADIRRLCGGGDPLYFYDAIAPIVSADSIDRSVVFEASRYDKGGADYLNCPLDEAGYVRFVDAVRQAPRVEPRGFEASRYFEGCLPIEVMADRGLDVLRFGPLKPVGLVDPRTGARPHAVVQLRAEDIDRTAFNLVGFQTRMKWGAQKDVFRTLPGLADAEFLRMGSVHRNTYLDAPRLLDDRFRLVAAPHVRFAGQITGVEGYVESTACGLLVALMVAAERQRMAWVPPPATTALGALYRHVRGARKAGGSQRHGHVPSNIHWGLCPPLARRGPKRARKEAYGVRALRDVERWWADYGLDKGTAAPGLAEPDVRASGAQEPGRILAGSPGGC